MTFTAFMSGWGWVVFSLFSALFSAGIYLTNQYLKQRGDHLVFWSRSVTVLLMAPFTFAIRWPDDWRFYAAVGLTVFAAVFADVRLFDATAKYGGGVVSRVQPLVVWGSFFLWFLFEPHLVLEYAARPVNTGFILFALSGCVYFARRQARCELTKSAIRDLAPALAGYAVVTVFNKYAMMHGSLSGAAYGYMLLQSALSVPILALVLARRARARERQRPDGGIVAPWRTRRMALAAVLVSAGWIVHMSFKNYAMAFTPNPSYQAAMSLTTPLFISLFYLAARHRETADVKSGMGVIACALLLALATVHG